MEANSENTLKQTGNSTLSFRNGIYKIISGSGTRGSLSWYFDIFLISLIILNVLFIVLESVASIKLRFHEWFHWFDVFSVSFFSVEYILRVWSANENEKYRTPFWGNLKYMLSVMALIDLFAILPYYLPLLGFDLRIFRILRLTRLLRLFKIARYLKAVDIINVVLKDKKQELVISFIFVLFMLLISSTVMYYVEYEIQPDKFSSIPETMWWSVSTLTTVGYGDIFPITPLGKIFGGIIALLGVGLIALPTGIIVSGFTETLAKEKHKTVCPNCKHEFHS